VVASPAPRAHADPPGEEAWPRLAPGAAGRLGPEETDPGVGLFPGRAVAPAMPGGGGHGTTVRARTDSRTCHQRARRPATGGGGPLLSRP
jgi:hypothetical protein